MIVCGSGDAVKSTVMMNNEINDQATITTRQLTKAMER
jgi:hypothetical protein